MEGKRNVILRRLGREGPYIPALGLGLMGLSCKLTRADGSVRLTEQGSIQLTWLSFLRIPTTG